MKLSSILFCCIGAGGRLLCCLSVFLCHTCLVCKENVERLDIKVYDVLGVDEVQPLYDLPDEQLALLLSEVIVRS